MAGCGRRREGERGTVEVRAPGVTGRDGGGMPDTEAPTRLRLPRNTSTSTATPLCPSGVVFAVRRGGMQKRG